ncbi:hypothetical protein P8C59_008441 [Phyllachora maydis]|uniref:DNA replication complex GINS protein PSF3 n=1 Tax=Phyllachora maydis TaxID=1825666 RepID=A0AAD9MGV3_9PEZI|nr:hypothetical protein P8C59_008441 [Phyllachora maydis]
MSYYDIDAILTDAEKVPCTFELDVPDLGHLESTHAQHGLKSGARLSLPLWLAEMLAIANVSGASASASADDSRSFVTLGLPPALAADVVNALKADPRAVPLRDQSPHFYTLATRLLDLFEDRELAAVLRRTFAARAAEVALHARKAGGGGGGDDNASNLGVGGAGEDFLRGLDETERALFRRAHDGVKAGREWMERVKKH